MRWKLQGGTITPESFAIAGGRATLEANGWTAYYYITDHLGSTRAVANTSGNAFATFDYTPYGSLLNAEDTPTGTDYLFTGKERQAKQGAGELYDSQARFMDTGGRFLSIDPMAEKYYHLSPYAYCAGDPVNMVDPEGRIFTDSLAKYVTILRKDINNKIREYKENNKDLQSQIDELNNALKELDVLEESTQLYDIQHNAGMPLKGDPEIEYHGWTEYDLENNTLVIKISPSDYDALILIHELKHAYQFETGYMSFNPDGKTGGFYYDITDEEEAFYRAYALGNKEKVPPSFYYDKFGKYRPNGGVVYPYNGCEIVHQKFRKK